MENKKVRAFLFLLCYNRKLIGDSMRNIDKEIKLNDDRTIRYHYDDQFIGTVSVSEIFKDGTDYRLYRTDDYTFTAYDFNDDHVHDREIAFRFDINHPYYMPLLHLLSGDDELVIDDDNTREDMLKYLKISKENDDIILTFVNNKEDMEREIVAEKYYVFIKNIMFDGRSKLDRVDFDNNVKKRLFRFFCELDEVFAYDYHQITIEEYMLRKEITDRKMGSAKVKVNEFLATKK